MPKVVSITPPRPRDGEPPAPYPTDSIIETLKTLLAALPLSERERIVSELIQYVKPISVDKSGSALAAVSKILPLKKNWTVEDIRNQVVINGAEFEKKEIYNAIGYLTRKGNMRRLGYGRYVVDGVEVVTADDLGGASSRNEDAYRLDRE